MVGICNICIAWYFLLFYPCIISTCLNWSALLQYSGKKWSGASNSCRFWKVQNVAQLEESVLLCHFNIVSNVIRARLLVKFNEIFIWYEIHVSYWMHNIVFKKFNINISVDFFSLGRKHSSWWTFLRIKIVLFNVKRSWYILKFPFYIEYTLLDILIL